MFSKLMDEHVGAAARDTLTGPPVEFTVKACVCQLRTEHTVNNVFPEESSRLIFGVQKCI